MTRILQPTIKRDNTKSDYEEHKDIIESQIINERDTHTRSVCLGCHRRVPLNGIGLCKRCQAKVDRGETFDMPSLL